MWIRRGVSVMGTIKADVFSGLGNSTEVTLVSNKLTGTASGSITLPGEGGTAVTNLQQGLSKAFLNLNGTGTIANRDSHNISGITDSGTGNYEFSFTTNMGSANFICVTNGHRGNDHAIGAYTPDQSTSGGGFLVTGSTNSTYTDSDNIFGSIIGDLG